MAMKRSEKNSRALAARKAQKRSGANRTNSTSRSSQIAEAKRAIAKAQSKLRKFQAAAKKRK